MSRKKRRRNKAATQLNLADPMAPYPGNINTMDPRGLDNLLWTPINDLLGVDVSPYAGRHFSEADAVGLSIALLCGDVIATALQKSDLELWREGKPNQYTKVRPAEHWLARALTRKPRSEHRSGCQRREPTHSGGYACTH